MVQHNTLQHNCIGAVITELVTATYPLKIEGFHLSKALMLDRADLFAQKTKTLSQYEISGDNYLFWGFLTLQRPQFRKKCHEFEEQRTTQRFLFGQLTVCNGLLFCDCREIDFFYWARIAHLKKWFDEEDVRDLHISYFSDALDKLRQHLLLEQRNIEE
jgi:hypothetical protein